MIPATIKKIGVLLMTALLLFSLPSCGSGRTPESGSPSAEAAVRTTMIDREGNTVIPPEKVDKIVSLSPSITETLIHLGLGDKLAAVDQYSAKIPGLPENLPAYDMITPDNESIAALKPDIIFATRMSKETNGGDPFKPIMDLGVFLTYIPSSTSIEGIKEDIRFIGEITDTKIEAESIVEEMEKEIDDILDKISEKKSSRTVYFEIAAAPNAYSFGKGTFLNEMIELLGAKNILAGHDGWVAISEEALIAENPDIIFTNVDYIDDPVADILYRNGWNAVNAVKNKQVYLVDQDASSRPNEYISVAFRQMAMAMYPEVFT